MITLAIIISAYLCGSISTAILVCKLFNLRDPRSAGSNNPGTTNVLRIGGKLPAAFTLFGDFLKGFLPVIVVNYLLFKNYKFSEEIIGFTMLAAFLGHLFPIFFKFKGGKGFATFLGTIFALNYLFGFLLILIWLVTVFITRYSSLGALIVAISSPVISVFVKYLAVDNYFYFILLLSVLLLFTHRENINRLINKKEDKIISRTK